ncbi:MAG: hypothetical protein E6Q97_22945 [Desulfurellales bacterium]|nr:MAG: hypothetical protein E6Q97_22945 [Desulfurellales bacterium]
MTQQELWSAYCVRNPSFAGDGEVTMTANGLKKLFEQTWRIAHEAGVASEKERGSRLTDEPTNALFEAFFGKTNDESIHKTRFPQPRTANPSTGWR